MFGPDNMDKMRAEQRQDAIGLVPRALQEVSLASSPAAQLQL